jgi:hypothetical protein
MKNVGGKRESLSFYCPDRPLYIENVALRAMYSLSMLEHVQSTHEHSMYSMISMISTEVLYFLYTAPELSNLHATIVSLPPTYIVSLPPLLWLVSPDINETLATWVQTQFKRTDPCPKFVGGLQIRLKTRAMSVYRGGWGNQVHHLPCSFSENAVQLSYPSLGIVSNIVHASYINYTKNLASVPGKDMPLVCCVCILEELQE